MLRKIVVVLSALALVRAQLPNLGWCPEYVPMANFDMSKFLGTWYEAESFFQFTEFVSRCVMANYTRGTDGRFHVSNEVTNRFTGVKRVLDGEIKPAASKSEEGKLTVKYTTLPLTPETKYSVLETDYKNYAVMWSCSGFGPVHTQNAWIMTRERLAPGEVLQKAYGVLDKYKISKAFFVKTDQDDCAYLATLPTTPAEKPQSDQPQVEEVEEEQSRFSEITPDAPNVIVSTRKAEIAGKEKIATESAVPVVPESQAISEVVPNVPDLAVKAAEPVVTDEKEVAAPATVPELILKVADQTKEIVEEAIEKIEEVPKDIIKEQESIPETEKIVA